MVVVGVVSCWRNGKKHNVEKQEWDENMMADMCFVSEEVRVKAKVRKGKYVLRIQSKNGSQKIKARQVKLKMWPRMLLGRRPMALKIPRRGPNSTNHSFISLEERLLTVGQKYFLQRDSVHMKNIFIYFILLYYLHLIMHVFQFDVCLHVVPAGLIPVRRICSRFHGCANLFWR